MAKTQITVDQIKTEAVKPFYAVAGATELAVELARGYATEAQKSAQERISDVQTRVSKVDRDPKALQTKARTLVNTRVEELQAQAKDAQAKFEARVEELQKDAKAFPKTVEAKLNEALDELNSTYADLAKRGEKFVAAIKKDGVKAVTSTKPAKKAAAKKAPAKKAPASKTAKKAVKASA